MVGPGMQLNAIGDFCTRFAQDRLGAGRVARRPAVWGRLARTDTLRAGPFHNLCV